MQAKILSSLGLVTVLSIVIAFSFGYHFGGAAESKNSEGSSKVVTLHTLDVPIEYFGERQSVFSSGYGPITEWTSGAFDLGVLSAPTTTLLISTRSFANVLNDLPPTKSLSEIAGPSMTEERQQELCDQGLCAPLDYYPFKSLHEEQYDEYGDIVLGFLADGYYFTNYQEFDVTGDGQLEVIIDICGIGGNHCPHKTIVVSDDKIIFSTSPGVIYSGIKPANNRNGFYLYWTPSSGSWDYPFCCPPGYMKTRFIYKEKEFVPVYEQEGIYVLITNEE